MARRILFAISNTQTIDQIVSRYDVEPVGMTTYYDEVPEIVVRHRPDAVVIADNLKSRSRGFLDVVREVAASNPDLRIITILSPISQHLRSELEQLTMPVVSLDSLVENVGVLLQLRLRPRGKQALLTAWSLKGGVGKTTLNLALAMTLKRLRPSLRVLLWDLDLVDGDAAIAMRFIRPNTRVPTLADILAAPQITPHVVESAILHHPSGVDALIPAYRSLAKAPLGRRQFYQILDAIRALRYNAIVFDLDTDLHRTPLTIETLQTCNYLFLVSNPNPFAVAAIQRVLPIFRELGVLDHTYLVCNQVVENDPAYDPAEQSEILSLPVAASLPADPKLQKSQELGVSVWDLGAPKAGRELENLARRVLTEAFGEEGADDIRQPRPSLLGKLLGR